MFSQGFTCPDLLFDTLIYRPFVYGTFTLSGSVSQLLLLGRYTNPVSGLFHVRSPLLAESRLISFPLGT